MSISFYLWLHLAGISLVLLAIGGMAQRREERRRLLVIAHGVGLLVAFVGGFGLLARYGIHWPLPVWAWVKVAIWIVLGGVPALLKRKPELSTPLWWGVWVVFLVAAYIGINRATMM